MAELVSPTTRNNTMPCKRAKAYSLNQTRNLSNGLHSADAWFHPYSRSSNAIYLKVLCVPS